MDRTIDECIRNNQVDKLKKIFKSGRGLINNKDQYGLSFLHKAVERDDMENIIILLIDSGININIQDNGGDTPLNFCICNGGRKSYIKILLDRGAAVNIPNKDGNFPLFNSINNCLPDVFELLLKHGANLYDLSGEGESMMEYTLSFYFDCACCDDDEELKSSYRNMIKLLALYGADHTLHIKNYKKHKDYNIVTSIIKDAISLRDKRY